MATYAQNGGKPIFNEFITPIGRLVHCYHDKPQPQEDDRTKQPVLDKDGIPMADFKVTVAWPKTILDTELIPFRTIAGKTRDEAWPNAANDQWFVLQTFLRDGDNPEHNTKRKEYLFGQVYLNFKQKAVPIIDPATKTFRGAYSGAPGLVGPYNEDLMPIDVYAGCYARVSGIMFGSEYMGKNFISVRLNNIQKGGGPSGDGNGERLGGGGRPDAKSQFDPLKTGPAPGAGGLGGLGGANPLGGGLGPLGGGFGGPSRMI